MAKDERPRWGPSWLLGLTILVIGVIVALGALNNNDDDGTSAAADDVPEAAAETPASGSTAPGEDAELDASSGPPDGPDEEADAAAGTEEAECAFLERMSTLTLDGELATALAGAGIEAQAIAPATGSVARGVQLPIVTSRKITCGDYGRVIGHRGGLEMDLGTASIELRRFRITTLDGGVEVFTDSTTDSGVTAFTVDLNAAVEPNLDNVITLRRVPLTVTAAGAKALNAGLSTTVFAEGMSLGLLDIR